MAAPVETYERRVTPLEPEAAAALCGGVALYLLADVAFKLRTTGDVGVQRLWAALLLLAYEAIRFRDARARVRVAA